MINKVTPRKLNPSLDSRLRKKDEMLDALNVDIKSDSDGDSGDVGVLKPIKGSLGIEFTESSQAVDNDTTRRVIGSVTDEKNDIIFYFLFSELAEEQGVYAYDPNNILSDTGGGSVKTVYTSPLFNFPENGFVKADVVYTTNHEVCNLYFTDNRNEPRRLDVKKAMGVTYTQDVDITDFITACPKTPIHPIEFEFVYDSDFQVSEFRNIPGFQFAYQCIYEGGEESAISTYSDIAVPPSYVQQGTINTPNLLAHNTCRLTIPKVVNNVTVYSNEIEKVRILGRIGNDGSWYTIDEVDTNGGAITYDFRNDRVLTGVPDEDVQKQFTSLPRKAQAQTVIDNRLFYGNYVENFDEPEVDASMTLYYRERPTDFINLQLELEEVVLPTTDFTYNESGIVFDSSVTPNRRAGYKLNTDNLPDSVDDGTVLTVNLTVHPDQHIKIYDTEGGASHHSSKNLFGAPTASFGNIHEGLRNGVKHLTGGSSYFGDNVGVIDGMTWTPEDSTIVDVDANGAFEVVCGTSASNPLSIVGRALNFSCTLQFQGGINANGKEVIRDAVCQALTGGAIDVNTVGISGVELLDSKTTSSYSYNIGLDDEDGVDSIPVSDGDDFRKNLINALKIKESAESGYDGAPVGYFIINSADVSFSLVRHQSAENFDEDGAVNGFFYLSLDSISNVVTKNCIPKIGWNFSPYFQAYALQPRIQSYNVYSNSFVDENVINGELSWDNVLKTVDGVASDPEEWNYFWHEYGVEGLSGNADRSLTAGKLSSFGTLNDSYSLVDGESGPAVKSYANSGLETTSDGPVQANAFYSLFTQVQGSISFFVAFTGNHRPSDFTTTFETPGLEGTILSIQHNNFPHGGEFEDMNHVSGGNFVYKDIEDLQGKALQVEIIDFNSYIIDSGLIDYNRSFKTKANHDFGVVYYDERGRAGNVNRLPTVYVPGYSAEERGSLKGRVEIGVQLNHQPPDWAHHYQIVYAGNSSVSDFVQYTTGGAFVAYTPEGEDIESRNIYVSLNYLQEHPTVSYSKDFGAVSTEGLSDIYTFKQGDRLRIVSYYTNDEGRIFPRDFEFDIVDSVILTDDVDTNPLVTPEDISEGPTPSNKTGRFLILKNSPKAVGFSYQDVAAQLALNTNTHQWNDRCVVEIYSPLDRQNSEDRVYYEIGKVYNVVGSDAGLQHGTNPLILRNGDVWWRRVPVNMPDYDEDNNFFINLIPSDGDTAPSKFRDYYLETKTFNDTLANADQLAWGKIKTVSPINKEIRRDSSITYSDKNNYASQLVRFTSFNPSKLQFRDLPAEHGAINYILNHSDSVFCIQEEKTSALPVDRSILSDASGVESLIASSKVIGTQKFYAGAYGCDDNPESVVKVDNFVYFANKSRQEVYRFSPETGVSVISDSGMKQYFRNLFNRAIASISATQGIRVVGGYDPLKDEFLISIMNTQVLAEPVVSFYEPPVLNVIDETTTATDFGFEVADIDELSVEFGAISSFLSSNSVSFSTPVTVSNLPEGDEVDLYGLVLQSAQAPDSLAEALQQYLDGGGSPALVTEQSITSSSTLTFTDNTVEGGVDYIFAIYAVNPFDINETFNSTSFSFQTPIGVETGADIFDINIENIDWTLNVAANAVSGFAFESTAFSSAPNHQVEYKLVEAESLDEINGVLIADILEGGDLTSIGQISNTLNVYPVFSDPVALDAGNIQTFNQEYFPSSGPIQYDGLPHTLLVYIHDGDIIKRIETLALPAFTVQTSSSPTLLEFVDDNGVTVEEAEAFENIFNDAVDAYYLSLAQNPDTNSLFTENQLQNLNNYNDPLNRDSDINNDLAVGTNDLLQLLASYGLILQTGFLQDFEGQPGFEIATDPQAVILPPGSISEE